MYFEYIGNNEAQTRSAQFAMDNKIIDLMIQHLMTGLSVPGKNLDSLKDKERRAKKSLKLLGVMEKNLVLDNDISYYKSSPSLMRSLISLISLISLRTKLL